MSPMVPRTKDRSVRASPEWARLKIAVTRHSDHSVQLCETPAHAAYWSRHDGLIAFVLRGGFRHGVLTNTSVALLRCLVTRNGEREREIKSAVYLPPVVALPVSCALCRGGV